MQIASVVLERMIRNLRLNLQVQIHQMMIIQQFQLLNQRRSQYGFIKIWKLKECHNYSIVSSESILLVVGGEEKLVDYHRHINGDDENHEVSLL